jgi:hypothetical protein
MVHLTASKFARLELHDRSTGRSHIISILEWGFTPLYFLTAMPDDPKDLCYQLLCLHFLDQSGTPR